jgi:signal transduction histidine kinase/ActR/RegA family two-component response regulator
LLAAGLATAVAVNGTPAALALVALFIGGAVVITASPLRPVLALAPWALASVLLWRAGDSGALLTLQLLAGLAVALGALLARQRDATLARRHVRFWRQRLAQRRQRALAQGRARYIAAASHDLRQPLHAMSFLARALLDRFAGDREMSVVLRRLEQATSATDQMFRDLLQLAQIDSSSIALKLGEVPLATIFESLQSTHTPVASKKKLVLQFYKTDALVRSDPVALLRILNNLVSNAVRYTDRGSVEVRASRHGSMVQVRVRDTGPGIAAADQAAIFEEFRQLSSGRGGTGLGLAIARRLAQALGHSITLDSTPGKGSTFTLTLPGVDLAAESMTGGLTKPAQEKLILFVENDEDVRKAVRPVMESWGYSVIDATNGVEAEERLSALMTVPDVMIVDQDLGGGEVADDVVRRIRQAYGEAIPSLVVTGNMTTAAQGEQLSTLHKPVDPDELRKAVERARRAARQDKQPTKPSRS